MADTQRTRSAILSLFADNATGQISAQDLRDFAVTIMESEFVNGGDFWAQPQAQYTTTDRDVRGWIMYSQTVDCSCSFGEVMYLTPSNTWSIADATDSLENYVLAVAGESYASDASACQMLRKGMVNNSLLSGTFSGKLGYPVYLESGVLGGICLTAPTYKKYLGAVMHPGSASTAIGSGKWWFDPEWAVVGT